MLDPAVLKEIEQGPQSTQRLTAMGTLIYETQREFATRIALMQAEASTPHPPSCKPEDVNLRYVCSQCGHQTDASGIEAERDALRRELAKPRGEVYSTDFTEKGWRSFKNSVDEALNSGDGSYRP